MLPYIPHSLGYQKGQQLGSTSSSHSLKTEKTRCTYTHLFRKAKPGTRNPLGIYTPRKGCVLHSACGQNASSSLANREKCAAFLTWTSSSAGYTSGFEFHAHKIARAQPATAFVTADAHLMSSLASYAALALVYLVAPTNLLAP